MVRVKKCHASKSRRKQFQKAQKIALEQRVDVFRIDGLFGQQIKRSLRVTLFMFVENSLHIFILHAYD